MQNKSKYDWIFNVIVFLFLVVMIAVTIYPLYYVVMASFSQPDALMSHRGLIFRPLGVSLKAYESVFKNPMIPIAYGNTIFYVAAGTLINLLMTTLGAYGLSRKNVRLAGPIMFAVTFTMLFSGGMIPLFLLVRDLGWINSRLAVLVPTAISVYNLIIMRTNFESIPSSLEESAKIDGANDFVILFRIVLPLSKPVIAVMVLFYCVSNWNSWFPAMVYLRDRELFPLQLILREILITNSTESMTAGAGAGDSAPIGATIEYATIVVSTLPILLVYPFLQKYFVKGVMIGAIKG